MKITKGRKAKIEKMLSLMSEAEEGGCDEVWGMRGKLRMVSWNLDSSEKRPFALQFFVILWSDSRAEIHSFLLRE